MILGARLGRRAAAWPGPARSLAHLTIGTLVVAAVAVSADAGWRGATPSATDSVVASRPVDFEAPDAVSEETQLAASAAEAPADGVSDNPPASGAGAAVSQAEAPAARLAPWKYTVQPGDSLAEIALQFGIDVSTLLGSNDLDDPDLLPTGRQLTILPVRGVLYEVDIGDTLNTIAERYGVAAAEILRANAIRDADLITVGDELIVPGAKSLNVRRPAAVDIARAPATDTANEPTVARDGASRTALAAAVVLPPASSSAPESASARASASSSDSGAPVRTAAAVSAPAPVAPGRVVFAWPASGPITTYFGEVGPTSPRGHAGLDIAAPWGSPVRSAAAGQVILATRSGGPYGIEVIVDHGGGLRTVYGHLSELDVETGRQVERGELLGLVGSTGYSTGPHLHFEVRQGGELRDPLRLLP